MGRAKRLWGFDDEERRALVEATANIPRLAAVIARASRRAEVGGMWVVEASMRELDEMYCKRSRLMS
jgi:hypothetical protein